MSWYTDKGPDSDVVLSSRVRLARNLCNESFPNRLEPERAARVARQIAETFLKEPDSVRDVYLDVDLSVMDREDRMALAEHRLISEELARDGQSRRALVSRDESVSVMLNEEDHIRIQGMAPGLDLNAAYRKAEAAALRMEDRLDMAYSETYGFLTACPTNTGTGMRASVMVHLPGLKMAGRLQGTVEGLGKMGFAVRGHYGEHSQAAGNLFQISNQITLGLSEDEILTDLQRIVDQLVDQERRIRKMVYDNDPILVRDRAARALGILRYAGRISTEEAMRRLSEVRLGVALEVLTEVPEETLNQVMAAIGPASVQKKKGTPLGDVERDVARAEIIQSILGGGSSS